MNEFAKFEKLKEVAKRNQSYLCGEIDDNGENTIRMAWEAINVLRENIPEIRGGFGVGFPFHSVSQDGILQTNPEFHNYSEKFISNIEQEKQMGRLAWRCVQCQDNGNYSPDLCSRCDAVLIKPRDVMKVMPDIDLFVVADNVNGEVLDAIQTVAKEHSFHQSDHDSVDALRRVEDSFQKFIAGGKSFFPADVHVVPKNEFIIAMNQIALGSTELTPDIRSMYYTWSQNSKIDLWFDFVFSGTFNKELCDPDIIESVTEARRNLAIMYSEDEILSLVIKKNERAQVLLRHEPTLNIFLDRIRSWKEL